MKTIMTNCSKIVFLLLVSTFARGQSSETADPNLMKNFNDLRFEENKGQVASKADDKEVLFVLKDKGITLFFDRNGITYRWHYFDKPQMPISEATGLSLESGDNKTSSLGSMKTSEVSMKWHGTNSDVVVRGEMVNNDVSNYYLDHCPMGITNVKSFKKIVYENIYPNTDVIYYIKDGKLKYDVILKAGADPNKIQFGYEGYENIKLDHNKVVLSSALGELEEDEPLVILSSGRTEKISFALNKNTNSISFDFRKTDLDTSEAMVIDPFVSWRTYYGGTGNEVGTSSSADLYGNILLGGYTASTSGISSGGQQNSYGGGSYDAFLVKFDQNGGRLWATYYGGTGDDYARAAKFDLTSNIYLTGETSSSTGISSSGHQNSYGGGAFDGFLVKFNSAGVRQWATYYGGSGDDFSKSLAIDKSGNIFIAGETTSTTAMASGGHQNVFGGGIDAFIVKFNSAGSRSWGSYYGGNGFDVGTGVSTDAYNNVYLVGHTNSSANISFNGNQNTFGGLYDGFLVKLNDVGARQWATYYGSNTADYIYAIDIDRTDNIYVAGLTGANSFVTKYNLSGTILITNLSFPITFLEIHSVTADAFGNLYVSGDDFYSVGGVPGFRAICGKFNSSLVFNYDESFRIYGSGQSPQDHGYSVTSDPFGNIYWVGSTIYNAMSVYLYNGIDLLSGNSTTGFQNINGGQSDAFLTKIHTNYLRPFDGGQNAIHLDDNNNIYTIGTGNSSYYLKKHNSSGVLQWTATFPISTISKLVTLAVDKQGNVYLTGATYGTTGVAMGGHQNSFGGGTYDAFIMKYNTAGSKVWGTYYGSTGYDYGTSVTVDKNGDVILAGYTSSTQSIASQGHQNSYGGGSYDGFAVKFNSSGTRLWGTYYGGTDYDYCRAVSTDLTGNIYVGGSSTSTNGIASSGYQNTYAGNSDGILVKLSSSGVRIWGTYYGGSNEDRIFSLVCDDIGNVFAGINTSSTSGIASGGHQNSYGGGSYDNAVVKFNSSGSRLWATYSGGSGWEELADPQSLALDAIGNVYLFGQTNSCTGIAYNGIKNNCSPPPGSFQTYMAKYSNSGGGLAATYLNAYPYGFAVDKSSKLYFPGSYIEIVGNFISPPVAEPTSQATSFVASSTITTISVSYSFATGSPQGYVAIRKQGSSPSAIPVDGTSYAAGQTLGDGVVVYSGSGNNFTDSGLNPGTQYYYTVYSYNGFGANANYYATSPLSGNATTKALATEPTNQPTGFTAYNITSTSVTISYSAASGGATGYLAIRKMDSAPIWIPEDAVIYSSGQIVGDAVVAYVGTGTTFNDSGLLPNTYYNYNIFSYNGGGKTGPAQNYLTSGPLSGSFLTNYSCGNCRLAANQIDIKASWNNNDALVTLDRNPGRGESWSLERSTDEYNFKEVNSEWIYTNEGKTIALDKNAKGIEKPKLFYRIRSGNDYSEIVELRKDDFNLIAVYPNPGQNKFNIVVPSGYSLVGFEFIDTIGQVIKQQEVNTSFQIDCSEFPQGIYYLKLAFKDQSTKIIKVGVAR